MKILILMGSPRLHRLDKEDREMFITTIRLLNETAKDRAIVEMCGHAIYVGLKA